jgi:hypothetical protein
MTLQEEPQPQLTPENYARGFLVSDELMAGVSRLPEPTPEGEYLAYVIRVETGEHLGARPCPDLETALAMINTIPEPWKFEAAGGCGEGCGEAKGPHCATGACGRPCDTSGECAF